MAEFNELYEAILKGNLNLAKEVTTRAVASGEEPQSIIQTYMIKGMEEIGAQFESGKVFVPNLLMSARAMKGALDILKPLMEGGKSATLGCIVIGTVKGDLHDIGKNLVASMLEGCGFEIVNLGVDVSSEQFVEAARKYDADIVCMSALLTTTMNYMADVVKAFEATDLKGKVKIVIGGAPVNEEFARQIGADGYSSNANEAVLLAKRVLQKC